jgi:hypothetical protein
LFEKEVILANESIGWWLEFLVIQT